MKRLYVLCLTAIAIISLASCEKTDNNDAESILSEYSYTDVATCFGMTSTEAIAFWQNKGFTQVGDRNVMRKLVAGSNYDDGAYIEVDFYDGDKFNNNGIPIISRIEFDYKDNEFCNSGIDFSNTKKMFLQMLTDEEAFWSTKGLVLSYETDNINPWVNSYQWDENTTDNRVDYINQLNGFQPNNEAGLNAYSYYGTTNTTNSGIYFNKSLYSSISIFWQGKRYGNDTSSKTCIRYLTITIEA